ncbi:MAG TPA: D-glycerate dehydrogenase [Roseiflexaceae bacterium]|nr:D-glycerate dehydrogenase [Roseiflexaceae bacterium]HMP40769.1 D-glycerate dehydrogenase [Roseiflexaceae bacterium]
MPPLVITDVALTDEIMAMIGNTCTIVVWPSNPSELATILAQAEGIFTYGHPQVDGPLMDLAPNLKVISNFGVGVDHIDLAAARERGIPVGNTPGILDGATADMTFALLLAVARNLVIGDRFARSADFTHYDPGFMLGYEVHGTTIGIIGMGNIGRQVARRAHGFDMHVLYHNRRRDEAAEADIGAHYTDLNELLQTADYVTLNMPLTPETRGMIGREQLALMKPSAFLINVARGGVVDHDALLNALQQRQIAGAALDVTEPEPLPRDHPLLALDNLIIMPHLGSATRQTRRAMAQRSVDNLLAGLAGLPLPNRIA